MAADRKQFERRVIKMAAADVAADRGAHPEWGPIDRNPLMKARQPFSLAATLGGVLRSLHVLLIWCVLFLAGASQSAAFAPEKRVGNFFAQETIFHPENSVQVVELHLDNPVWEAEFTLGSTVWTKFDPEGLSDWLTIQQQGGSQPCLVCHGSYGTGHTGNVRDFSGLSALPNSGPQAQEGYRVLKNTSVAAASIASPVDEAVVAGAVLAKVPGVKQLVKKGGEVFGSALQQYKRSRLASETGAVGDLSNDLAKFRTDPKPDAAGSVDPHTAGVARTKAALEAQGIPVSQTEMKVVGEGGRVLTDADLVIPNAIIEYKSGPGRASDIVRQVQQRIEPNETRPVVVYGESLSEETIRRAGSKIVITKDIEVLSEVVK